MIRKIGRGSYSGDWYGITARQRLQAFFNNASVFKKIVKLLR
jgi:ABC-type glycerol-3-phosphate transport system substrate-binding protein